MSDHGAITLPERSWTGLLSRIRTRPGMYLGTQCLQALHLFMQGFRMAERVYSLSGKQYDGVNDFPWDQFESYVNGIYNQRRLSLNSFGLAQYEAQSKDISTFDMRTEYPGAWEVWWKWYDEFNEFGASGSSPRE